MPNDLLVTTTDILGIEVAKDYSGASGIYVDNVNNIISITGDVGKEYNGVNPIVVNNEENLISANSAPIGVQEPLYFVQDDDEAVVIGLSGEYVTPSDIAGKLDTSSFESWQQGQYTNDLTAINEKINEVSSNIPSIEGLATEQLVEETSATIVSQIPSIEGLASETYVQEQTSAKASKSDLETVSGDIVNLIPDVSNYYTKSETSGAGQLAEAFSQIGPGGDEEVNSLVHSNSATWNEVSSKLDESTFQEASGLFLTAIPQEYITESDIPNFISAKLDTTAFADVSGSFLTAHQSLEGYATEQFVEDTSASITALIPTDYYPNSNPSGFITGVDLSQYYQKNETSSKEEISAAIAAIPLGDEEVNQAVHTNSGTWNTVTDKLDTTSFSDVSGTFLTAHQSLEGYATTSDLEQVSADITATIPSTAGLASESYVQTNSAVLTGMIDGKQDTLTFGYDEQDRISAINNSAIAAGDEFPASADEAIQYVQTNSAGIDETVSNVQTNSGAWGGSALPISAGPGIKFDVVNGTLVASTDETVLFNGNISGQLTNFTTTEPISNFKKLDVYFAVNDDGSTILGGNVFTYDVNALYAQNVLSVGGSYTISNGYTCFYNLFYQITNSSAFAKTVNKRFWIQPQSALPINTQVSYNPTSTAEQLKNGYIYKIVGIDRIGGN